MTSLLYLRALHLLGAVLWMGGAIAVAGAALRAQSSSETEHLRAVLRKYVTPGMLLAFAGGLVMLGLGWAGYARAGWMHSKLLLVVLSAGLTGMLSAKLRKHVGNGPVPGISGLLWAHIGLLALILLMVMLGPVWMPSR